MASKRWADIADEDDLAVPVIISKHGIKVAPPPKRPSSDQSVDKIKPRKEGKTQ